jgi:hypothetical protein
MKPEATLAIYTGVRTAPSKGRRPGGRKKLFNRHHAQIRALLERGAATSRTGTSCAKPAAHPAA